MAQRFINFLVVLLLICHGEIFAQKKSFVNTSSYAMNIKMFHDNNEVPFFPIGKNLYPQHLNFFCKKEWQFEKMTTIPLRLRIGSLDYTNYLEMKLNANNFIFKK